MKSRTTLVRKLSALALVLATLAVLVPASPVSAQETIQAQPPTVPAPAQEAVAPTPPAVSAQPQPAAQPVASEPQSREVTRWYGGLTLAADATSVVLALTAIIVDAAALAYQTVRERVSVQPLVSVRRDALWLGVGGAL